MPQRSTTCHKSIRYNWREGLIRWTNSLLHIVCSDCSIKPESFRMATRGECGLWNLSWSDPKLWGNVGDSSLLQGRHVLKKYGCGIFSEQNYCSRDDGTLGSQHQHQHQHQHIPDICHIYHIYEICGKNCHVEKFQIVMHEFLHMLSNFNFSTWQL